MAQITRITSEALQATIRRLLPSQQGFGEDLQASNVITPIIDLTPTAEGSSLPLILQTASSYDDVTAFTVGNSTSVIANTAGFWKITYAVSLPHNTTKNLICSLQLSDGLGTKNVWKAENYNNADVGTNSYNGEITVYLNSGESISAVSNDAEAFICGSAIQIADTNGVLSNPAGFSAQ